MAYFVTEKDIGLYDAMNKGLLAATGDFVWFMNAGDTLHTPDTVAKMVAKYNSTDAPTDVFFGEVTLVNDRREPLGTRSERTTQQLPETLDWRSLRYGMVVCHQAFVARRSLCPPYVTDNLSADIDWVITVLRRAKTTTNTNAILADFLVGGVSKQRHRASLQGRFNIMQKHYGLGATLWAHLYIAVRAVWHRMT